MRRFLFYTWILILSIVLRFVNYSNRWGLAADQARDILVVRQALFLHVLPLIGPFSASGPFVFGPFWYWALMLPIGLFPHVLLSAWIFQSILYVGVVPLFFVIGKKIYNTSFGLLLMFFAAVCPAYVKQSNNLIMSALVGIFGIVIVYFFIDYLQKKKVSSLILLSFFIGLAINTHFEAVPLSIMLPIALIRGRKNWPAILCALVSFLLPFIPLGIFTIKYHPSEVTNMFHTLFTLHKAAHLPLFFEFFKNWIVFFIVFLPQILSRAVTGNMTIAYGIETMLGLVFVIQLLKHQLSYVIKILLYVFLGMSILFAYYPGTLFAQFFLYVFPFLLIFTAYGCYLLYTKQKVLGIVISSLLLGWSLVGNIQSIMSATNTTATTAYYWEHRLLQAGLGSSFDVYSYGTLNKDKSLALSMILSVDGHSSLNGEKIGVGYFGAPITEFTLINGPQTLRIYNLDHISDMQLRKQGFIPQDQERIYRSVEEWYK